MKTNGRRLEDIEREHRNAKPTGVLALLDSEARSKANEEKDLKAKARVAAALIAAGVDPFSVRFEDSTVIAGRKFRFDVTVPHLRIAVEVHGGVYSQGRHTRGKGFVSDRYKMRAAQLAGWLVLEFVQGPDLAGCDEHIAQAVRVQSVVWNHVAGAAL